MSKPFTQETLRVPINSNPAFRLQHVSTTTLGALCTAKPVENWNSSDGKWEEDTWEYLLMQESNVLEHLWASLQAMGDLGVVDEVNHFQAVNLKLDLLLATQGSLGAEILQIQDELSQYWTCLKATNLEDRLEQHKFSIITPSSGAMPYQLHYCTNCNTGSHF
ncbi:uncharacterized protein FIBRA_09257 [Fibroporia radiculosa]|uniref:Uncharacterized protein n=1 Tax=Fibroporia radiculosa TaxID=599839 RepID=J7SCV4_9APHY|nr:uncharacterized protein FIBRA_09257 [Fibroporia radiculosa]CCM06943.1 predicted protein [Fibroporia radiculosa]